MADRLTCVRMTVDIHFLVNVHWNNMTHEKKTTSQNGLQGDHTLNNLFNHSYDSFWFEPVTSQKSKGTSPQCHPPPLKICPFPTLVCVFVYLRGVPYGTLDSHDDTNLDLLLNQ